MEYIVSFPLLGARFWGRRSSRLSVRLLLSRCSRQEGDGCPAASSDHEGEASCSPLDITQAQKVSWLLVSFIASKGA